MSARAIHFCILHEAALLSCTTLFRATGAYLPLTMPVEFFDKAGAWSAMNWILNCSSKSPFGGASTGSKPLQAFQLVGMQDRRAATTEVPLFQMAYQEEVAVRVRQFGFEFLVHTVTARRSAGSRTRSLWVSTRLILPGSPACGKSAGCPGKESFAGWFLKYKTC